MNKISFEKLEKMDYSRREAFNSLRTNLSFCGVDNKVIMFTSCTPNEGKSTVCMDLCRSLAEDKKKVILIDADIRKSVLVGRHHIQAEGELYGLSHYLSGQKPLEECICNTDIKRFDLMTSGPVAPNPTELLGNHRLKEMMDQLRDQYDIVIVDCPPLGWVIDAAVIAPNTDGAIIVVESNAISYRYLQDVKKQLEITGVPILGAVLNKVKVERGGYYHKGKYGKYGKYGGKYSQYGEYGNYGNLEESADGK